MKTYPSEEKLSKEIAQLEREAVAGRKLVETITGRGSHRIITADETWQRGWDVCNENWLELLDNALNVYRSAIEEKNV